MPRNFIKKAREKLDIARKQIVDGIPPRDELVHHENYSTRVVAKKSVFEYIEVFYNRQRLHSSNGYLSPVDYELQRKAA